MGHAKMSVATIDRLAFLLGSGTSIPGGMPSTSDITARVLYGQDVYRETDGTWYLGTPPHYASKDRLVRVLALLRLLCSEIDKYYQGQRNTNYEDLFYVASQIRDSELGEYDNPAVQPLVDKILPEIRPSLAHVHTEIRGDWDLHEVASDAADYVRDIAWRLLAQAPKGLDHLKMISDACDESGINHVDIFTLNHDTLLEDCFVKNGLRMGEDVADGFGRAKRGIRYWERDGLETATSRVRLFKLHGSIDWFHYVPDSGDPAVSNVGIPGPGVDFRTNLVPTGDMFQSPEGFRPYMLAGTFNKMLRYTGGVYGDLHGEFHRSLRMAHALVVGGYGFGDKGINAEILYWAWATPKNSIVVIHPDAERLRAHARGAISKNWELLSERGKLKTIPARFEGAGWNDVRGLLLDVDR